MAQIYINNSIIIAQKTQIQEQKIEIISSSKKIEHKAQIQ